MKATFKANRLLAVDFEDEKLIHPEPMVTSQPQKYIVAVFVAICREFGINSQ